MARLLFWVRALPNAPAGDTVLDVWCIMGTVQQIDRADAICECA